MGFSFFNMLLLFFCALLGGVLSLSRSLVVDTLFGTQITARAIEEVLCQNNAPYHANNKCEQYGVIVAA